MSGQRIVRTNIGPFQDIEKGEAVGLQRRPAPHHVDSGFAVDEPSSYLENGKDKESVSPQMADDNEAHREEKKKSNKWVPSKYWIPIVILGLGACWIPAILEWLKFPQARVWGVRLIFWSIWLSIIWAGGWVALIFSWMVHKVILYFVNRVNGYAYRPYVNAVDSLHQYFALVAWILAVWITWVPVIVERRFDDGSEQNTSSRSARALDLGGRIFFAAVLSAGLLFLEKTAIQWIAMSFHKRAYRNSINNQKEAVRAFKELYDLAQKHIPEKMLRPNHKRSEPTAGSSQYGTLGSLPDAHQRSNYGNNRVKPGRSSTKTAFADAWIQIFGKVAPDDVVVRAFHRRKSQKMIELADEIWNKLATDQNGLSGYCLNSTSKEEISAELQKGFIEDLIRSEASKQTNPEETSKAGPGGNDKNSPDGDEKPGYEEIWNVLTSGHKHKKSITGSAFIKRCSELHAEQLRLEGTMNDLNNVVGKLDNLLLLFWFISTTLIAAVALEAELKTLILAAGSAFVGMSWLLKDTASEVLGSLVFLFNKHPYDVGDKVVINSKMYTVKEMRLLSTVFTDDDSVQVQAPNKLLNTLFVHNLRRSPATSEPFTFEISDETTQDQLKELTEIMERFLGARGNEKDYRPEFLVVIQELSCQDRKMVVTSDIQYNNNWESDAKMRAERRNKWIMSLRDALREAKIEGPGVPLMKII